MEQMRGTIDSLNLVSAHSGMLVELELLGEVLGDVTVGVGVTFILTGVVRGDVIALKGSTVTVNGYVGGNVANLDASLRINGSIGSLSDSADVPAAIAPESHIRDRPRPGSQHHCRS